MYIVKRFGLDSFLFEMSQMYELVIFSSLKSDIVEQIVSLIDPKKYISYCLTRQHCVVINQTYFIKPVRDLGRDTKNVIAVDVSILFDVDLWNICLFEPVKFVQNREISWVK